MLGPEMMEKESSILEISTAGFLSASEILIVKITDSVIEIFLAETNDDISLAEIKLINDRVIKKILTILCRFHLKNYFVFASY
jgi:hypothetical protein